MSDETRLHIVAMVCLTVIVLAAIVGLTVAAVTTDRDLRYAEGLTAGMAVCVGLLGGLTLFAVHRRHRWRVEREEVTGDGR